MWNGTYSRIWWMDEATRGIRFGPDREAVRQELNEHLEDKIADLRRFYPDMTEKEAEQRALAQMGDAGEIGKELARIHTPWLGYLWRFSQVLLAAAVLVVALGVMEQVGTGWRRGVGLDWEETQKYRAAQQVLYEDGSAESLEGTGWSWNGVERLALYPDLDQEQRLGEATITLSRVALWQMEEGNALYAQMRIAYDKPWEKSNLLELYLQAEDSLGNHYGYDLTIRENGASLSGMKSLGTMPHWNGYAWNFALEGLPEEAQWVRFSYALRPNSDVSFVIDLSEGVGA